jgi:hypothetical protein
VDNQQTDRPDDAVDNLDTPIDDVGATTGEFGRKSRSRSLYTEMLGLHPNRGRVLVGAALAAGAAILLRAGRS